LDKNLVGLILWRTFAVSKREEVKKSVHLKINQKK